MVSKQTKRKQRFFRRKTTSPKPKTDKAKSLREKYTAKQISQFKESTEELKKLGSGKIDNIYFRIPKQNLRNIKEGSIIKQPDGLYQVTRITKGCASVTSATIYCIPFDPQKVGSSKVLIPK